MILHVALPKTGTTTIDKFELTDRSLDHDFLKKYIGLLWIKSECLFLKPTFLILKE